MIIFPDINDVQLTGRLAEDPQHRTLPDGLQIANAKFTVGSRFLSTEKKPVSSTFNLVFFGPQMTDIAKRLVADDKLLIKGELRTRSTSKNTESGNTTSKNAYVRTTTEIIVRVVTRCIDIDTDDSPVAAVPAVTALPPAPTLSANDNPRAWSK
jgi:single-stranded DNA-binding protein